MGTQLRSNVSSFILAIIGTALSGTIAAFIVIMVYANFQLAAAGTPGDGEDGSVRVQRSSEPDRCRFH
jgi:hypothetical protein